MSNTFKAAGTAGWTAIVDGANFSRFGVQIDCQMPVQLCIASAAPPENSGDYLQLDNDRTREFACNLASADKVYIKTPASIAVAVRGFREGR